MRDESLAIHGRGCGNLHNTDRKLRRANGVRVVWLVIITDVWYTRYFTPPTASVHECVSAEGTATGRTPNSQTTAVGAHVCNVVPEESKWQVPGPENLIYNFAAKFRAGEQ